MEGLGFCSVFFQFVAGNCPSAAVHWHAGKAFNTRVWRAIDECLWWRAVSSSFEPWVLKWNIHTPSNSLLFVFA
jgi:hypothetical protein